MDRRTVDAYERGAARWIARRGPSAIGDGRLAAFLDQVPRGGRVADLGCGPGWYAAAIQRSGRRVIAVDLSAAMLAAVGRRSARVARLRSDLAALPLARQSLDGAWAMNCYCHLPRRHLALALADLHAALRVGAPLALTLPRLDAVRPTAAARRAGECERRFANDSLRGRLFTAVTPARATALLVGAGFTAVRARPLTGDFWLALSGRRARTLPDLVRPGLRLLICGLNPSLYSADAGLPFARPGNRFWPAAVAAGVVTRPRDLRAALRRGIGFTDLVKRASAGADVLSRARVRARRRAPRGPGSPLPPADNLLRRPRRLAQRRRPPRPAGMDRRRLRRRRCVPHALDLGPQCDGVTAGAGRASAACSENPIREIRVVRVLLATDSADGPQRTPAATRNMTSLPAACGEKGSITSSSKNVRPVAAEADAVEGVDDEGGLGECRAVAAIVERDAAGRRPQHRRQGGELDRPAGEPARLRPRARSRRRAAPLSSLEGIPLVR